MPGKGETVTIAGMLVPIRLMDRLITNGELLDYKLTDRGVLLDRRATALAAFVAGVRVAEQLVAERRGLLPATMPVAKAD